MNIVDSYWTNYEFPEKVDRKTEPPVLNFDLVKRINGRNGEDPEPFWWRGEIVEMDNELTHSEMLVPPFNRDRFEIHTAASTFANFFHKFSHCDANKVYKCKVNRFGKSLQIQPSDTQLELWRIEKMKKDATFSHSQKIGVAMDLLFTTEGKVNEDTNAVHDKLAYFCIFEKKVDNVSVYVRKEVDIMLKLKTGGYLPVELKTRTWLGMNKKAFCVQFLPKLITRCFLTNCFTVIIAVRDEKSGTAVDKVLFFEDVRDLCPCQYKARTSYYRNLVSKLKKIQNQVTHITYTQNNLYLRRDKKDRIKLNLDVCNPSVPLALRDNIKPYLVICDPDQFDDVEPTLSDLCTLKNYSNGQHWCITWVPEQLVILVWNFGSLLTLLRQHNAYNGDPHRSVSVFIHNGEDTPSEEEIEFVCLYVMGSNIKLTIKLFDDKEELEELLEEEGLYENCPHALVLLGEKYSLPDNFAVRSTDVFKISTFPRIEFLELITFPEKIAVFGSISECVQANEKLSQLKMFEGYEDLTYFFLMELDIIPNINMKNIIFVSPHDDMLELLKTYDLPYCL